MSVYAGGPDGVVRHRGVVPVSVYCGTCGYETDVDGGLARVDDESWNAHGHTDSAHYPNWYVLLNDEWVLLRTAVEQARARAREDG